MGCEELECEVSAEQQLEAKLGQIQDTCSSQKTSMVQSFLHSDFNHLGEKSFQ